MEEIYSITNSCICQNDIDKNGINLKIRCLSLYNTNYRYSQELLCFDRYSQDTDTDIDTNTDTDSDWISLFVNHLSENDDHDQLQKVFKFIGIIQSIEIDKINRTAIITFENKYNSDFHSHIDEKLVNKNKYSEYYHSICLAYTVWKNPIIPFDSYDYDEFIQHFRKNHTEIESIHYYDIYLMFHDFDKHTIPNFEKTTKFYKCILHNTEKIKNRIIKTVTETPSDFGNFEPFYPYYMRM